MKIGDKLTFGNYEWRVLEVDKDRVLIITDQIIEQRDYHDKSSYITWKDSEIRSYLNNEFYNRLSDDDKSRIIEVINKNPDNPWYKSFGGEDTKDKIFILSLDEVVRKYFGDSSHLLDNPLNNQRYWFQRKDANNISRQATLSTSPWWWWVRTPGRTNRYAVYIHGDGNIGIQGNGISKRNVVIVNHYTNDNRGGVRPALWLKI